MVTSPLPTPFPTSTPLKARGSLAILSASWDMAPWRFIRSPERCCSLRAGLQEPVLRQTGPLGEGAPLLRLHVHNPLVVVGVGGGGVLITDAVRFESRCLSCQDRSGWVSLSQVPGPLLQEPEGPRQGLQLSQLPLGLQWIWIRNLSWETRYILFFHILHPCFPLSPSPLGTSLSTLVCAPGSRKGGSGVRS